MGGGGEGGSSLVLFQLQSTLSIKRSMLGPAPTVTCFELSTKIDLSFPFGARVAVRSLLSITFS